MCAIRNLKMSGSSSNDILHAEVDEDLVLGYGGFGSVFPVRNIPDVVVKRVELEPQPIGNISAYVAHIRTTRDRLLAIKNEELLQVAPRQFIVKSINEIVEQSLSSHWCFDLQGMEVIAVWFLQKKARGRCLIEHFNEPAPSHEIRARIARGLLTRMRTLRRADLVHMDCVADNIFVEDGSLLVSLIDLDGCGIVRRQGSSGDDWDHPPFTLGHLNQLRVPPWYPQAGLEAGPKEGNYLFGERWVVIDTLIRILTWNKVPGSLAWTDLEFSKALTRSYKDIGNFIAAVKAEGLTFSTQDWIRRYELILTSLKNQATHLRSPMVGHGQPACLLEFMRLAQSASVEPRVLSSRLQPPYDVYLNWLK